MSRFLLEQCHIRYNPPEVEDGCAIWSLDERDDIVIARGVLTLMGWTPETAHILHCHFERDESLTPGTMLITPLGTKRSA